jgi:hypothetical protein
MCAMAPLFAPSAAAQPAPPPEPSDQAVLSSVEPAPVDATPEAVAACRQFARALDTAAASYSEFANVLAIGETVPNYADPILTANNSYGRDGLREAASTALSASRTPGLSPAIATPMRSWSMGAMKLMLLMGLRADVERFNNAATELNTDTEAAQMACAEAGTRA